MAQIYDVVLKEAAGTIAVMEWLRDNKWPDGADMIFFYDKWDNLRFTCSKEEQPPHHVLHSLNDDEERLSGNPHEYLGMLRYGNPMTGWYLNIEGQWYFLYH